MLIVTAVKILHTNFKIIVTKAINRWCCSRLTQSLKLVYSIEQRAYLVLGFHRLEHSPTTAQLRFLHVYVGNRVIALDYTKFTGAGMD